MGNIKVMKKLILSDKESSVFFDSVNNELRVLINEYDDDTGRIPGKRRMGNKDTLQTIMNQWHSTQPHIADNFISYDNIVSAELELSDREVKVIKNLLGKNEKDLMKELAGNPAYEGVYAYMYDDLQAIKEILKKL